jgi:hypothetical protein
LEYSRRASRIVSPSQTYIPPQRWLACIAIACLLLAACRQAADPVAAKPKTVVANGSEDSGAVSSDAKPVGVTEADLLKGTKWPALQLTSGEAWVDCDADIVAGAETGDPAHAAPDAQVAEAATPQADADAAAGVGGGGGGAAEPSDARADSLGPSAQRPLVDLGFSGVKAALSPCREQGVVRLRYQGKISSDFTALVQRTAAMADRMDIGERILDIDSTGGRVEDAMPAGDAIAGSHWTMRVREDSVCHSACVLVLAAGDDRIIAGKVGIHRMVRVGSTATTRAELSQELREVYGEIKDYLERNGASAAVADLMMTVPNRSLRLLSETELREYGLSGTNAVQDDLDRIILARKCGDDFVKRKDAFVRAYASQCALAEDHESIDRCGEALRSDYGFPDEKCKAEGPLAGMR